jgi:ankyrin repeat protein
MKEEKRRTSHQKTADGLETMRIPIIEGALRNDFKLVSDALEQDPKNVNLQDPIHKLTALHAAVSRGNLNMVKLLLEAEGVDISIKDEFGRDALDLALTVGHQEVTNALFRKRAEQLDLVGSPNGGSADVVSFKPK